MSLTGYIVSVITSARLADAAAADVVEDTRDSLSADSYNTRQGSLAACSTHSPINLAPDRAVPDAPRAWLLQTITFNHIAVFARDKIASLVEGHWHCCSQQIGAMNLQKRIPTSCAQKIAVGLY